MRHYEHSGAVPILGLLLTLAAALVLSVLGPIYTFLVVWVPFVYVTFLLTFLFGAIVGLAIGIVAALGKIRNTTVVAMLGVLGAVPAYYAAWMFDPLARLGFKEGVVLVDPQAIYAWMNLLYDNGGWGIRGVDRVKGPLLAAVWLIEAGAILGTSGFFSRAMVNYRPFCETCQAWTREPQEVRRLSLVDVDQAALDQLANGRLEPLAAMLRAHSSEDRYLRLDLACCPTCTSCNVLTIHLAKAETDNKGKVRIKTLTLADKLLINPDEVPLVRFAGRKHSEAEQARLDNPFHFLDDSQG